MCRFQSEGAKDFNEGYSREDNPYESGYESEAWDCGWCEAKAEQDDLLVQSELAYFTAYGDSYAEFDAPVTGFI